MIDNYTHLTEYERYQIYEWHRERWKQAEIGRELGRDKSTITREQRRNSGQRGYWPHQAQQMAQ